MDSNRHGDWPLECKVYIGDLGEDATRRELEEAFDKFGRVRNVWIAKRPPGFAFVLMDDPRDAEDATRELDGSRMCGRRVKTYRHHYPSLPYILPFSYQASLPQPAKLKDYQKATLPSLPG